jgi:hypothetical protein
MTYFSANETKFYTQQQNTHTILPLVIEKYMTIMKLVRLSYIHSSVQIFYLNSI